jgi:hypothetical protein
MAVLVRDEAADETTESAALDALADRRCREADMCFGSSRGLAARRRRCVRREVLSDGARKALRLGEGERGIVASERVVEEADKRPSARAIQRTCACRASVRRRREAQLQAPERVPMVDELLPKVAAWIDQLQLRVRVARSVCAHVRKGGHGAADDETRHAHHEAGGRAMSQPRSRCSCSGS